MLDRMVEAAMAEFKQNLADFCEHRDVQELTPENAEAMCEGLKQALAQAGTAALRAYLTSFEEPADVVAAQGEGFRFKQVREKKFLTPFGEMVLPRRCYQNKSDTKSYVPLDAGWGMEGQYMAPHVREAVLFSCAHVTPEETAQLLEKCALFTPHATAIKHVVENVGKQIAAHQDQLDEAVRNDEPAPEDAQVIVASLDGATVLLNEKGKRFGRPAERPGGEDERDTKTAYRTAMVGSISHYSAPGEDGKPRRLQSRYVAHMPEARWPGLKAQFEAELAHAEANAPPGTARILLLDGARELWSYVDKNPRYDAYAKCIDFWHAAEHLSLAAEALFGKSSEAAKNWYEKYYTVLLEYDDGAARIMRSMDYYAKANPLTKTRAAALNTERTYFRRNKDRMPYAAFRRRGWPIGSGPIEAACKTLVKTRLCRSGMRWSREGGQRILTLRTYVKSNRWGTAWKHIKQLGKAA